MAESGNEQGRQVDWTPEAGERLDKLINLVGGATAAARIAGKSDETLNRYRKGESRWELWAVARLCKATGKSLDWLIFGQLGVGTAQLSEAAVEKSAEYILRAAREFPDLKPEDIARSIVRRARDLDDDESALTDDQSVGAKYTPR